MSTCLKKAIVCLIAILPLASMAQKDDRKYAEEADAMRKDIWSWDRPEFKVRTVPDKYADRSSVVIAHHVELNADSKKKATFKGIAFTSYRALMLTEIVRELVKINDKSAVSDYSQVSYTQLEKSRGAIVDKTTKVFIGVRVIKPDGSMREVNTDDIVMTKDEKKDKEAKVAIPDLQVGDLVDYFIATQTSMEQQAIPPYTFTMYDDAPILDYSIHCEVGKKYAVEYHCYNNAPAFTQSEGDDGGVVLDMEKKNIPALAENTFWISPYRQLPVIRMNIMIGTNSGTGTVRRSGEVYANPPGMDYIQTEMTNLAIARQAALSMSGVGKMGTIASNYFKKLRKDKNVSPDSLASELYYAYRFDRLLDIDANTDIETVINYASRSINESAYLFYMGLMFKAWDVDSKMVVAPTRYGPDLKDIIGKDQVAYLLLVNGGQSRFYGMDDVFSPAFYIPPYFENIPQAYAIDTRKYDKEQVSIPGTSAGENVHIEKMDIKPALDQNAMEVSRTTTLRGHYKSDVQKDLILFEDFYEYERKLLGSDKSLIEQLEDGKRSKKYADELKSAFAEARSKQKDAFLQEAKNWFELDINNVSDCRILNLGVRHYSPDFTYAMRFNLPGTVKKAGNNYLIDIGRLEGSPLKVEAGQRKRFLDVYAPFARSLQYEINVQVPEGYTAEGVSNLNKLVENESGLFSCEATTEGNTVHIKVKKIYRNAFEPAGNWDKVLAFIDAANDWSNAKLLLRKK